MDGRSLLAAYLDKHGITLRGFAATVGPNVPFSAVWAWARATKPKDQRTPGIAYALRIESVTDGAVPVASWAHDSSRRASTESGKPSARGGVVRRVRRGTSRQPSQNSR